MASRVLVVEDDDLQRKLLSTALSKRGYDVDTADDGLSALRKLRTGGYDIALIDYQLPELDGYASARILHDLMPDQDCPKLIAVSACPETLADPAVSRVFDDVLAKPLQLPTLFQHMENQLRTTVSDQTVRASERRWHELGLSQRPAAMVLPRPGPAQLQLLRSYFDLSARREPDLVLLLDATADIDAMALRMGADKYCLPFVDLTGHHLGADAQFSVADTLSWASVAACVGRFAERRQQLAPSIRRSIEPEARLLAYMFLSGRSLRPTIDAASRECVTYPGFFSPAEVRRHAEQLAERGWLDRTFFDRFHLCASCTSSRLNVREECPVCNSAQLQEVSLIHHFRCAHQAPERDFTRGANLVCPKCRQHLRHYGSDYDRSGIAMSCGGCGAISPEPSVGFTCLDCGARTSGQAARFRDAFAYRLTDTGLEIVRRGLPRLPANEADRPDPVLQQFERAGPDAALFELSYRGHDAVATARGEEAFQSMRRTFLANLASALDGDADVVPGSGRDHVILPAPTRDLLAKLAPPLLRACQRDLAADLQPELTLKRGRPDLRS